MPMRKKYRYCVRHKKDKSLWFFANTMEEAQEWVDIAEQKAQEPSSHFYIRKERL